MNRKITFISYYVALVGLFACNYTLKTQDLDGYRKKVQYDQAITYLATGFEEWEQAKKSSEKEGKTPFAMDQEREELEIFRLLQKTEKKQPILPYVTNAGRFGLYHILLDPITDIGILKTRQQFIKKLMDDEPFYTQLQTLLKRLAKDELEVFSYWNPHDSLTQKANSIYFSQPKTFFGLVKLPQFTQRLNHSSVVLELSTVKEFFKKMWIIIPLLGFGGIADNIQDTLLGNSQFDFVGGFTEGFKKNISSIVDQYNFTNVHRKELNEYYDHIDNPKDPITGLPFTINKRTGAFLLGYSFLFSGLRSAGDRADICQNIFRKNNVTIPYPVAAGLTLGRSLLSNYLIYVLMQDQIQGVVSTYITLQKLHTRTVAVARYIKTVEKIEFLLQENAHYFYRDCLIAKKETSKKMKRVCDLLHSDTFKKDGSVMYLRGKVLLINKLLQEIHTQLADRIRNMALVDAHVAVATFMKESEKLQMPTCYVDFVDNDRPIEFVVTNGWSPLIICQKQVCNSLSFGDQNAQTVILTGPNGCGKSTILRMLGANAWFGQTFGIGTAEHVKMSLFDSIRTSLRINDNAATGLSTYMAADAAAERIQTHIDQSNEQHRSLILYGEPYRGTPDQETTRKIMEFCHHIAPNKHFIMALETHVYEPTILEKDMPHIFTNGHMEINEDANGNFVRTFALKNGPANWWFLDHNKRRRFVDWITVVRKQEEIAQKAYEEALILAYKEALLKAKQEQEERAKKEKATTYLQKTVNGFRSLF